MNTKPFGWPRDESAFVTFGAAIKHSEKHPVLGVTQGGSSRKDAGAKPAATSSTNSKPRGK
jgi:hypothetical protein